MPRRNAVAPPQLARDAPVMDVAHPLEIGATVVLRDELDLPLLDHFNRPVGQRLDLYEPLRREPRLDDAATALALRQGDDIILGAHEEAAALQILEHTLPSLEAVQSLVGAG